jgi:hypothetical protein
MKKIIIAGTCLIALLAAGVTAFVANKETPAAKHPSTSASAAAHETKVSGGNSEAVVPSVAVPADAEEAKLLMEINQMILQVTQEALERPKDQRMSAEEISAMVRSRVEELESRR